MPVPGALPRAVQEITVGAVLSIRERAERTAELDLYELDLQYQLLISGEAGTLVAWTELEIEFEEWEFHYAPAQRESQLGRPHMTYGAYIDRGGPVGVLAHVASYTERLENDAFIGARIFVGVIADQLTQFGGAVDLTFQGFGMNRDDLSDTPDLEAGTE